VIDVGLWQMTITCTSSEEKFKLDGPGSVAFTTSFGEPNKTMTTSGSHGEFSVPLEEGIGTNRQLGINGFLTSGSTEEQFSLELWAENNLFEFCGAMGDAIPLS
jgi:hypothetical protein